ncbi:cytochrome P460 family protein [Antarcticimicrobium sediminis]|uniref:Cytochrome P460 domain-containing protein n=1 Tax=Antarcticimicrobium sediminis TaxID=2546227 RepID=A0A4R5F0I4_9RHOB|nr:cytochrome P460 family protein [Antarcticimicrobium sediminis]TDE40650.1 hypothetical protein E1B25_00060 [Antarcticimicrobium sediminis]
MKFELGGIILALSLGTAVTAQDMPPLSGTPDDVAYATEIWTYLEANGLAGPDRIHTAPYEGTDPHGMMLETFYTMGAVNGYSGDLVVKNNYGPEGVSADEVLAEPAAHLAAITVMFRREDGYLAQNQNWFWAKYLPDGTLNINAVKMPLAGRVAKGMDEGCISCHANVGGDDLVFTTDHYARKSINRAEG